MSEKFKTTSLLSILIVILALIASGGGLFLDGLYRDNRFVTAVWKGNDAVTLLVALPLLVVVLILAKRDSNRAKLIWLGTLDVILYNYAFFLFAARLNWFFLFYVALFTLPIFALLFGLVNIDAETISQQFRQKTPVKWIAGYMIFVALGLTTVYLLQFFGFVTSGQIPAIVLKTDHPTNVVPALDFSMVIPWLVLGGVWLWQRRPWGYVIGAIMVVKGAVYMLSLTAASISSMMAGFPEAAVEIPLWGTLGVGFLLAGAFFLGNMKPER
jgi:hypothetical protein